MGRRQAPRGQRRRLPSPQTNRVAERIEVGALLLLSSCTDVYLSCGAAALLSGVHRLGPEDGSHDGLDRGQGAPHGLRQGRGLGQTLGLGELVGGVGALAP